MITFSLAVMQEVARENFEHKKYTVAALAVEE
jgi:hypothetical protein